MTRLYPSLMPRPGETAPSIVSRLALLYRVSSVSTFALDMGFPFQAIVDGEAQALAALARLIDQPVEQLAAATIRRDCGAFRLKHQELVRASLRRARVVGCPRCLAGDLAEEAVPWMASGRVMWLLAPIRICREHHVPLVELAHVCGKQLLHDFARSVAPALAGVERLAQEAIQTAPTAVETYLLDRVDGQHGPEWLDALPWHAAARICEMIGAVAEFGPKAPIKTFGDAEWRQAGTAGFEIAAGGFAGIRALLERMRRCYPERRVDNGGPQAWFGRLHIWLTDTQDEPAYDPLRDIIIDFIRDTVPVGPEDRFFGRPVIGTRRLHSIWTASCEMGLHPKRLRRILAATGVISSDHSDRPDDQVVFEAAMADEVLTRAKRAISHSEAESYLNAGRVQTQILAKHGFIRPFAASKEEALRAHAYDRAELDAFLTTLMSGAVPVMTLEPPVHRIAQAAKKANCGAAEIIKLILDRRLEWVGRKTDEQGYASVLVNVEEIKRLVRGTHGDNLTLPTVLALLQTTFKVVDALVKNGILPTKRAISPLNRCPYMAVPRSALETFMSEYGSLQGIARERGIHFMALKKLLTAKGIEPALDRNRIPAAFYRRQDIPIDL